MADNYLERKMEDYRRGVSATHRLTHTGDAPGVLRLRLQPCPVLIYNAEGTADETLISMLTGAGFKVAFTAADMSWARALAQRVGALYLPSADGAVDLLRQRWRADNIVELEAGVEAGVEASSLHSADVSAEPSGHCGGKDVSTPLGYALRKIAEIIEQPINL